MNLPLPMMSFLRLSFLANPVEVAHIGNLHCDGCIMRFEMQLWVPGGGGEWERGGGREVLFSMPQSRKPVDGQNHQSSLHEIYNTPRKAAMIDSLRANCLSDTFCKL